MSQEIITKEISEATLNLVKALKKPLSRFSNAFSELVTTPKFSLVDIIKIIQDLPLEEIKKIRAIKK